MIRTLFIIAGAALVLCLVTLGGAAALGGHDLQRHGWSWTLKDNNGESVRFERIKGGGTEDMGPITTRSLPWTGGEALKIESAINVEYVQGPENTVVITGPKGLADRVRLEDGRLYLANGDERVVFGWNNGTLSARSERDELKVVVTTPNVRRFEVSGSSDLSVTNFDQPSLAVAISGSADVTVTGRTDALDLSISGSGDAYLDDLKTTDATVNVAGSGTAQIAPTGKASITISGSGDVDLSTRPAQLVTNVSGSGSISQG